MYPSKVLHYGLVIEVINQIQTTGGNTVHVFNPEVKSVKTQISNVLQRCSSGAFKSYKYFNKYYQPLADRDEEIITFLYVIKEPFFE